MPACGLLVAAASPLLSPPALSQTLRLEERVVIDGTFGGLTALAVDSKGRIYAADYVAQNVAVFEPDGRQRKSIGRRGKGPGEFTGLRDISVRDDSLFALDISLNRLSVFSIADTPRLVQTVPLTAIVGQRANFGVLVASGMKDPIVGFMLPTDPDISSPQQRRVSWRSVPINEPASGVELAATRDMDWLITVEPSQGKAVSPMPFGGRPVVRVGPSGRLYLGWTRDPTIRIESLRGQQPGGTIRVPKEQLPLEESDLVALEASYVDFVGERAAELVFGRIRRAYEAGRLPKTKPLYKDFVVDPKGRVWLNMLSEGDRLASTPIGLTYRGGADGHPSVWKIIRPQASGTVDIHLRGDVQPKTIDLDAVYAVSTDVLGVDRIVVYDIIDGSGT